MKSILIMTTTPASHEPDPSPLYILLILIIGICCYFFFLGTAAVRLWFYKGALGPEPEAFILIRSEVLASTDLPPSPTDSPPNPTLKNRRRTVFHADSLLSALPTEAKAHSTALDPRTFSAATTTVNIQDISEDCSEIQDAKVREYVAEQRRISRLPAFDADDCGDGEHFPFIPIATSPVEAAAVSNPPSSLSLTPIPHKHWLTISPHYIAQHTARTQLLARNRAACIQVLPDAEKACRELMLEVCDFLVEHYPQQFLFQKKMGRSDYGGFFARGTMADGPDGGGGKVDDGGLVCLGKEREYANVVFANATLFPAGYDMSAYIGKSVDAIVHGIKDREPMLSWSALPDILSLATIPIISNSHHTSNPSLPSLREYFIQTSPVNQSLASSLHITRPIDFFAGNIVNLHPSQLLVRTSTQVFTKLPNSGAVVVATRTDTETLQDMAARMGKKEKEEFLEQVSNWGDEESRFKGRELWMGVVERVLTGQSAFRDDMTIYSNV
ncbi:alpha- -mannosyltransferase [Pyrenophora seminiperda CCB06]|uniref:Alpha--mannosyltransferase n=1 Tax=Pyrenophora seminiperda CCB06 TaxID=1302712 RepID=A0A3M7M8J7_9PLEO|nr:alpha- -mannosyltransferase [Pyrenophora seminiperda CCB06]